jgi:hypothetical protein
MTKLRTIIILTLSYFITILYEILLHSSIQSMSPKLTFLDHIKSSLTLTTFFGNFLQRFVFFIFFGLLMGLLMMVHYHGIFIIYITLLKFFELIPLLIDLLNLLFIYQYRIKNINKQNLSNRFNLCFIFALIRLIISFDIVRRKCDCRWKRQYLVIFDLLLFILVNITLLRYSNPNLIRIGRKIILGLLIFQLNDPFYKKKFWTDVIQWNDQIRYHHTNQLKMIHRILTIRWILSSFLISLFIVFTFQSININKNGSLFFISHIDISLNTHGLVAVICMIILYVIRWDTLHNRNALNRYGISRFCVGPDLLPRIRSTEVFSHSKIKPTTTVIEDIRSKTMIEEFDFLYRSPSVPIEKKHQTDLVCYDDKDLSESDHSMSTFLEKRFRIKLLLHYCRKGFVLNFTPIYSSSP